MLNRLNFSGADILTVNDIEGEADDGSVKRLSEVLKKTTITDREEGDGEVDRWRRRVEEMEQETTSLKDFCEKLTRELEAEEIELANHRTKMDHQVRETGGEPGGC